jgi:hypothetical protein
VSAEHVKSIKHAVNLLCGAYETWMDDRTEHHARTVIYSRNAVNNAVDAMARHWPQPVSGQLTGEALHAALCDAGDNGASDWRFVSERAREIYTRAAARLAAPQGVGFDVEAVGLLDALSYQIRLATEGSHTATTVRAYLSDAAKLATLIRSHVVTPSVSAGREVVPAFVEVTWADIAASGCCTNDSDRADFINARLRARAGTAGVQWITRPAPHAGALVVPEDGTWVFRIPLQYGNSYTDAALRDKGYVVSDTYDAIRRIDTDAPTTWIERTATAGGWTASSVEACVGQRVMTIDGSGATDARCWDEHEAASDIADFFNETRVLRYHIAPPVERAG